MKADSRKIRPLLDGQVLCGFAGGGADAFALLERFETKLKDYPGNVPRAATELAKEWRTDRALRRLEALLAVVDAEHYVAGQRYGRRDPTDRRSAGHRLGWQFRHRGRSSAASAQPTNGQRNRAPVAGDRSRHRHLYKPQHSRRGARVSKLMLASESDTAAHRSDASTNRRTAGSVHHWAGRCQTRRCHRRSQPLAATTAVRRHAQRSGAEEYPDGRPHGRRQNGDCPPAGQADGRSVHQSRSHQIHRSRLLRTRRREHGPRTGRKRHRHRPRAGTEERRSHRGTQRGGTAVGFAVATASDDPGRRRRRKLREHYQRSREKMRDMLRGGALDEREVEITTRAESDSRHDGRHGHGQHGRGPGSHV